MSFFHIPSIYNAIPFFRIIDSDALSPWAQRAEFRLWSTGEQLRSMLARADADFVAAPSHMPANLSARGESLKLLAISAWGAQWFVSSDPGIKRFEDLADQDLIVPLRHEMPGILIDELVRARRAVDGKTLRIMAARDFPAAVNSLLSGRASHALLVEPSVSAMLARVETEDGPTLHRVESVQQVWARYFPDQPYVPQSGLAATTTVAADRPLQAAVTEAYIEAARWCQTQVQACAELAHRYLPAMPVPALRDAITHSPLDVRTVSEVRPQLEAFYKLVLKHAPQLIGGRLPDETFYQP